MNNRLNYLAADSVSSDRTSYSSASPPSVPPKETFTFDFKEALDLRPSSPDHLFSSVGLESTHHHDQTSRLPSHEDHPRLARQQTLVSRPHAPSYPTVPLQPPAAQTSHNMAHTRCLQLCNNTVAAGDRVAQHMAEYAKMAEHFPHGFDALASDLLEACQTLALIQTGLEEVIRHSHPLPADLLPVLDKRFRTAQSDFRFLDQVIRKQIEYEKQGAMGRMRRGFGKMFGDNSVQKVTTTLSRTREDLQLSAYMFQWNAGTDKAESEHGSGYGSLLAAIEGPDAETKVVNSKDSQAKVAPTYNLFPATPQPSVKNLPHENESLRMQAHLPTPRTNEASTFSHDSHSKDSSHLHHTLESLDSPTLSPAIQYTASSAASSTSGSQHHVRPTKPSHRQAHFDQLPDETLEMTQELEALLGDMSSLDLDSSRVNHIKYETSNVPRRQALSNTNADNVNADSSLIASIRARDYKFITQLLDRGVSPNTIGGILALNEAVLAQDAESVRLLLLYGADPNKSDAEGVLPLVAAVEKSFLTGALALLKYGADPNLSATPALETPLAVAVLANNVRLAHLFLTYGGNPKRASPDGDTLLIGSINKKTPRTLTDLLLGYGADPNEKNREGKSALFAAITSGRADIVTSLIQHGANPNLPGPKHMLWPSIPEPACLQILLSNGADYKKAPGIMELATSMNNIESVRILLKAGVDPNAKKDGVYTPLCTSIRDDRKDLFQMLLRNGANPNIPASEYPAFKCITHNRVHFLPALAAAGANLKSPKGIIETAVTFNNTEALKWLLDQGLDPNDKNMRGHTPLTSAIRDGRTEMVELLLACGADVNVRGQDWPVCMAVRSPDILKRVLAVLPEPRAFKGVVEMAVAANQLESVKLLLAAGVSVEDKNGGVFSPLTTAIREYRTEIVRFLINEGGADVNAPGEHLPIVKSLRRLQEDSTEIMDMLLERGADPNKVYRGWNGIMQALENGDAAILKKLCTKAGVDLSVRDELGRTVTEIAISRRWEEAVGVLLASAP